jgi:predicted alpha/beta hydrolase family esterase
VDGEEDAMMRPTHPDEIEPLILTVPGLNGSGPAHWQSLWESSRPDTHRVELGMWENPRRNAWVTKLDQAIRNARAPVILVAHSLGCLAVAWWAQLSGQPYGWPVTGALLVAPSDVDRPDTRRELRDFAPSPRTTLPFPSIVVASSDDAWTSLQHARDLASYWGSHFVDAGPIGHINAASGVGWWDEGQALLDRVVRASGARTSQHAMSDIRSILAVNATDAAHAHYLGMN